MITFHSLLALKPQTLEKKSRVVAFAAGVDPCMKRRLFSPPSQRREEKRCVSVSELTLFVLYCNCSPTAPTDASRAEGEVIFTRVLPRDEHVLWPHGDSRAHGAVRRHRA